MTRYENNTRKHKADKQYIYEAKNDQCLNNGVKSKRSMCLHVLRVNVLRLHLGMF